VLADKIKHVEEHHLLELIQETLGKTSYPARAAESLEDSLLNQVPS